MADDIPVEGVGALPPADHDEYPDAELDERPRFDPPDAAGESDDGRGVDPDWICIEREAS